MGSGKLLCLGAALIQARLSWMIDDTGEQELITMIYMVNTKGDQKIIKNERMYHLGRWPVDLNECDLKDLAYDCWVGVYDDDSLAGYYDHRTMAWVFVDDMCSAVGRHTKAETLDKQKGKL